MSTIRKDSPAPVRDLARRRVGNHPARHRRLAATALAVATSSLIALTVLVLPAGAAQARPAAGQPGYSMLMNRKTSECLDVWGASQNHAATVGVWRCVGADNQQWRLEWVGAEYYQIRVLHSGKCLDVAYASLAPGAQVVQADCTPANTNQHWRVAWVDGSWYQLVARHSGMCLDKDYWGYAVQWGCHDGEWQQWRSV